jgi:hypothetical protein
MTQNFGMDKDKTSELLLLSAKYPQSHSTQDGTDNSLSVSLSKIFIFMTCDPADRVSAFAETRLSWRSEQKPQLRLLRSHID